MKHSYAILTNGIKHSDDCAITQTAAVAHKTNKQLSGISVDKTTKQYCKMTTSTIISTHTEYKIEQ